MLALISLIFRKYLKDLIIFQNLNFQLYLNNVDLEFDISISLLFLIDNST